MRRARIAAFLAVAISFALSNPAGLAAGGRASLASSPASAERVELYVDARRGDDSGGCRASSTPCRTIQRALDSLPMLIRRDVMIRIAPGEYPGEVLIADRLSWERRSLTLSGEPGQSILDGSSGQRFGIRVSGSTEVRIEGLTVQFFSGDGIVVDRSEPVVLHDVALLKNAGHGLSARQAEVSLRGAQIEENWQDGIECRQGWLTIRRHDLRAGLQLVGNGGFGLRAAGCEVRFEGAARIQDNSGALLAEHGSEIDLGGLSEILISGNTRPPGNGQGPLPDPVRPPFGINESLGRCEMLADHHGVIQGYQRAEIDAPCVCAESGLGICRAE